MKNEVKIVIVCLVIICICLGVILYMGKKLGYIDFLKSSHYWSLLLLILAGLFTWVAMVWIVNPDCFTVSKQQYVSLVTSLLISVLWWARYTYTVSDIKTND